MPVPPNDAPRTCLEVANAVQQAFNDQAWGRLRALYHDEALFVTVAGGDEPLGPDDAIAAIKRVAKDIVHSIVFGVPELLDEQAVVVSGSVRTRPAAGHGFSFNRRAWVATFKDDRLYRLHVCSDVGAATRLYRARGVTLGL